MHSSSYSYTSTIMGFRSYARHFRGAILGLLRPSEARCFPAGRWFFPWCFPSGSQQHQQQKSVQQQEEKVAKMHSSSYSYTTTIMGFRSYVRHFQGAILGLLRPSEAWCFPAGRWFFPWCFPSGSQQQQQKSVQELFHGVFHPGASSSSSKSLILVLLWVSEITLGIFGVQFWSFSVLQRHDVLLPSGSQQQQQKSVQQQEEKVAKMHT